MSNFKPQLMFSPQEFGKTKDVSYKTYAELKPNIKQCLLESYNNELTVLRSRRGEWGEFFEKWELRDGKPTIFKQGWM